MRKFLLLAPLALAGCNVDNDSANDRVTLEYNGQRIEEAAGDVAATAEEVAAGVGNVAESARAAIKNEVGDIDVDLDVRRNKASDTEPAADGAAQ